jgi:hypothetical protein
LKFHLQQRSTLFPFHSVSIRVWASPMLLPGLHFRPFYVLSCKRSVVYYLCYLQQIME